MHWAILVWWNRVLRSMILDMAIVIRKQGGKWEKTDKVIFADEAQLQRLLYESPELIPTKVEDQAAVFTREAGLPGSGFTDLVGVDAQGNILIVETKLARNGEIGERLSDRFWNTPPICGACRSTSSIVSL